MTLRHLEILEAIAQTGSFTGAARKLYLTQSAVSHAVAELEQQTGCALFDRLPRGVCLTSSGKLLLEEAQGILTSCRNLEERMSHLQEYAPINLVTSITIASFRLPQILIKLREQMEEVKVCVRVVSAASAMDILQRGEADLALIEGAEPQGPYCSRPFGAYQLWAACAPDYPLAGERVTPQELCAKPLLLREPGSAIRDGLDSALYLCGQTPRPAWESVNSTALISAAEAGLGVTVLPDLLLKQPIAEKRLRLVEWDGMAVENQMLAVYHRDKYITHSMQALLDGIFIDLPDGEVIL